MTYYLTENALGFFLFKQGTLDETSLTETKVLKEFQNFNAFKKVVSLEASHLFHGHNVAWETLYEVREGSLPAALSTFLKKHMAVKKNANLIVEEKNLAVLIAQKLKLKVSVPEHAIEIFRGIRLHIAKFVSGTGENFEEVRVSRANLGIGHAFARHCIQFDEKRQDKPIINAHSLLELMDKNLNIFAMRIKESYGWHFPELTKLVTDNETYIKFVARIGNKENVNRIPFEELSELVGGDEIANDIVERVKSSTGNTLSEVDQESIINFCAYVLGHFDFKRELQTYLLSEMEKVAPNLTALLGETVGAKLLTHAGGLNNLSKLPASTIQILGAEKALFRALKKKGNTPKYGLLYNSTFIGRADTGEKGKVSRMLSNKCAMAARLDCFLVKPTDKFGSKFKDLMEEKLVTPGEFEAGRRNIEMMEELVDEMTRDGEYVEDLGKRVKDQ